MPLLTIESNVECHSTLLSKLSYEVATLLGKPESYVMVKYQHNQNMLFAGSDEAVAFLQLKSLGLPDNVTKDYSAALCSLISNEMGITPERIYIEFSAPERYHWGWNSSTF